MQRKFGILVSSFVALFVVLTTPLAQVLNYSAYLNSPEYGETLTADEVNSFLAVWSDFIRKDMGKYELQQVSLANGKPAEVYPPYMRRWFVNQGWNIDRFFYVEQRLKAAVKTVFILDTIDSNRELMRQVSSDANTVQNLQTVIARQERQINAERITSQEVAMIRPYAYKINAILEGRA